jgi:hypothetical protein
MPAPKKPTPEQLRDAAVALETEAAAEETAATASEPTATAATASATPAPATPPAPPELDHATARPLARGPYRHDETQQTVFYHQAGWAFTATGIPIAPLTEAEVKAENDAAVAKAARKNPAPPANATAK